MLHGSDGLESSLLHGSVGFSINSQLKSSKNLLTILQTILLTRLHLGDGHVGIRLGLHPARVLLLGAFEY